jgi:hypothetical protein|tara:strand:- start:8352 stop:8525 length:174 start_codon:yes stop_codon:yes gene_type:complete
MNANHENMETIKRKGDKKYTETRKKNLMSNKQSKKRGFLRWKNRSFRYPTYLVAIVS